MRTRLLFMLTFAVLVGALPAQTRKDAFATLKQRLATAPCVRLEFLSIVDSEVFGVVDSTAGTAAIARDGRYLIQWGEDVYLFDGTHRHSFSAANNQVTVEAVDSLTALGDIAWITRIDAYYRTETIEASVSYRLIRAGDKGDMPDSVIVVLTKQVAALKELRYSDQNEDLNVIQFRKQILDSTCESGTFVPNFPDSADVVRLD